MKVILRLTLTQREEDQVQKHLYVIITTDTEYCHKTTVIIGKNIIPLIITMRFGTKELNHPIC